MKYVLTSQRLPLLEHRRLQSDSYMSPAASVYSSDLEGVPSLSKSGYVVTLRESRLQRPGTLGF